MLTNVNYLYLVTLIADTFLPKQASNKYNFISRNNNILLDKEWNNQQITPINFRLKENSFKIKQGKHH
jgi:hypothetical protein